MSNRSKFQYGTLVKREDAKGGFTWVLRFSKDGKRKAMVIGKNRDLPTLAEAQNKVAELLPTINKDTTQVRTFAELIERYIAEELPSRPQTAASYKSCINHLKKAFGSKTLLELTSDLMAIENWLADLRSEIKRKDDTIISKPMSKKTKQNIKATLHRMIEVAMKWGYLKPERNPISLVEVKVRGIQPKKRLKKPLTVAQFKKLIECKDMEEHVRVLVKLCYTLGLRISEALALRWEDIDFEAMTLTIQRGVVGKHIDNTKTLTSADTLPISKYEAETLLAWKAFKTPLNGWVFGSEATGRPYHRDSLQADHLVPAAKVVGIVDMGWHTLRHSHRALLRQSGTDLETQKMLMRHADTSTTQNYGIDDLMLDEKRPAHDALVASVLAELKPSNPTPTDAATGKVLSFKAS